MSPSSPGMASATWPFQVEVLLAADAELAGHPLAARVPAPRPARRARTCSREHRGAGDERVVDVDRRHGRRRRDARQAGGPAGLVAGLGDHDEQHLAVEHDLALGDQRIVADVLRADVVAAGDVVGGEHGDDAGRGFAHRLEVDAGDAAGGDRRVARRQMQRAGRRADVVDIERRAGDVLDGAVVGDRLAHDGERVRARRCRLSGRGLRSRDRHVVSGSMDFLLAMADDAGAAAGGAGRLDQRLAEQRVGRLDAVAGAGAVVVDRLEILAQRRESAAPGPRVAELAWPTSAASAPAARFGVSAMPPKASRASAMVPSLVDGEAEGAHDRGDVLIEALGHLVAAEDVLVGRGAGW